MQSERKNIEVVEDKRTNSLRVRIYDVQFLIEDFLKNLYKKRIITGYCLEREKVQVDGEKLIDLFDFIESLSLEIYDSYYNYKRPRSKVLWSYRKKYA